LSNFVKGKAPIVQDSEGYILYPANYPKQKIRRIHARKPHIVSHHAFMYKNEASSSRQSSHVKLSKKKTPTASNEHNISFNTFDASYVLTNKSGKVVAKYVGANTRAPKLVFGYPRCLFLTSKDPRLFGYLTTRPKIVL
jgi:CRISPR/Cas system-associated protein Cas7 (RAMP superfamily)